MGKQEMMRKRVFTKKAKVIAVPDVVGPILLAALSLVVIVFVSSWWATTGGELRHHHSPFSAVSEVCIVVRTFDGHAYEPKAYTLSRLLRSLVAPEHTNWVAVVFDSQQAYRSFRNCPPRYS